MNAGKKERKTGAANENAGGKQIRMELRIRTEKMTKTRINGGGSEGNRSRRAVEGMLTVAAATERKKVRDGGSKFASTIQKDGCDAMRP